MERKRIYGLAIVIIFAVASFLSMYFYFGTKNLEYEKRYIAVYLTCDEFCQLHSPPNESITTYKPQEYVKNLVECNCVYKMKIYTYVLPLNASYLPNSSKPHIGLAEQPDQ